MGSEYWHPSGGRLARRLTANRSRLLATAVGIEAVLVAGSVIIAASAPASDSGTARWILIALLGLTMGGQNAVVRALAVPSPPRC